MKTNFIIILASIILFSCNENKNHQESNIKPNNNRISNLVKLTISDTLYINKISEGVIQYNMDLDTLKLSAISSRYLFLHYTTLYPKSISFDEIKNGKSIILEDTLLKGKFNFRFDFNKFGNGVFNAAIEDVIVLKEKQADGKVRIITNETVVSKDVIVEMPKESKG